MNNLEDILLCELSVARVTDDGGEDEQAEDDGGEQHEDEIQPRAHALHALAVSPTQDDTVCPRSLDPFT